MDIIELGKNKKLKGKAGNLNNLFSEFNIAKGFVIPNDFFLIYLKENNIVLSEDRETIKKKIMNGSVPNAEEILKYFENNFNEVIVRSSASVEDGIKYSFAGQFSSFCNVTKDSLIYYIKKCWISQFEENVENYLKENFNKIKFDVLIQEMIITDVSGVAFSINPTNAKKEIVVEFADAQCEELVSGEVIPYICSSTKLKKENILTDDMFMIINDNLKRLKDIFNKEIEIEFGFRNNVFYLFQVRPITKIYFSLFDYINKEAWCCFKNNNWSLFDRTLWIMGARKYKDKRIINEITEDITLCYPKNEKQMRGFNGSQPQIDDISLKNFSIRDINIGINENKKLVEEIGNISKVIEISIKENNFNLFCFNLKKLIECNAKLNAYEYLIGGLGQVFYDNLDESTISNFANWRNSEDKYFCIYDLIFEYIVNYFNMNINAEDLKTYIHVNELLNLCNKKLSKESLLKRINIRHKKGFVLFNLNFKDYNNKIISANRVIEVVKSRFLDLQDINVLDRKDSIRGKSVFKNGKKIKGECVVINTKVDLQYLDIKGKILVIPITTAKDVKYLKMVKALVVDNGGILCHSAIFSREFNIPCLMGCVNASETFKTGDYLVYDVDEEIVRKIY